MSDFGFLGTTDENLNLIPSGCTFDGMERTCSNFFLKAEESYGEISGSRREAIRNKFCETSWNLFQPGLVSYIECHNTPGYIKHDCQNICSVGKIGNNISYRLIDVTSLPS